MTQAQKIIMRNIIYAVESGGNEYTDNRNNIAYATFTEAGTNSVGETGITIGAGQWHANRAKELLLFIRQVDSRLFDELDTEGIATDLAKDWTNYKLSKGSAKAACIKKIISSEIGKECQDQMLDQNVEDYMAQAAAMGVTLLDAQMMCANFIHQSPSGAQKTLNEATKPYTLEQLYEACLRRNLVGQLGYYKSRQEMVYTKLKELISPYMNGEREKPTREMAIDRMITIAEGELGYWSKASNQNLYDKHANPGTKDSNNYTKYWDYYTEELKKSRPGVNFQGLNWCAIFVTWVFEHAFGKTAAEQMVGFYPWTWVDFYRDKSEDRVPKAGDIFIIWRTFSDPKIKDRYAHTGIVTSVENDDVFYTIEGNTKSGTGDPDYDSANAGKYGVYRRKRQRSIREGNMPHLFFTPNYNLVSGIDIEDDKKSGWYQENGGWRLYLGDTGECVRNDWYKYGEYWFWFNGAGMMVYDTWYYYNDEWYWFDNAGRMLCNNWYQYEDKWYYFGEDGKMIKNAWAAWQKELYRLTEDGSMYRGRLTLNTDEKGALQIFNEGTNELGYINDGMLLCLDGIRNTRQGHDKTVTYWEDLSGNINDPVLNGGGMSFGDTYCHMEGGYWKINAPNSGWNSKTFEIVCQTDEGFTVASDNRPNNDPGIAGNYTNGMFRFGVTSDGEYGYVTDGPGKYKSLSIDQSKKIVISVVVGSIIDTNGRRTHSLRMYINGGGIVDGNLSGAYLYVDSPIYLGKIYPHDIALPWLGKIYSVRMYDRELSQEELKYNYSIDKVRFNF